VDAAQLQAPQLGRILIAAGLLSEEQLAQALEEQAQTGRRLGEIIVQRGFVSGPALANALAEQHGGVLKTEYGFASGLGGVVARRAASSEAGTSVPPLRPPDPTPMPQLRIADPDAVSVAPEDEQAPAHPEGAPDEPPQQEPEPPQPLGPAEPAPLDQPSEPPPLLRSPGSTPLLRPPEPSAPEPEPEPSFEPAPPTEAPEPPLEPAALRPPPPEPTEEAPVVAEASPPPAPEPTPLAEAAEPVPEPVDVEPEPKPLLRPAPAAGPEQPAGPDDRDELIDSLRARVEAQEVELATLREQLEQERVQKDVQVHVWPEEQPVATTPGPVQTEHYLLCVPTAAGYVLLDRVGGLPTTGQAVEVPEEEGRFTVTKVVRLPRNGRLCAYLQRA